MKSATKTIRDTSTWAKPRFDHTIKGTTYNFDKAVLRAEALRIKGLVRVKKPKTKQSPFNIRTYLKGTTIMPQALKAPIDELRSTRRE